MKQIDKHELFENYPIGKALKSMAVPAVIGQLVVLIYNMADTFFIGQINNHYMVAGASLVLPLFNLAIPIALISGTGGGTLVSRLLGRKKEDDAQRVGTFSIYFSVVLALIMSLVIYIFLEPILSFMGASDETMVYAKSYATCVVVFGGLPTVLSNTLAHLFRSQGYSKQAGFGISMGGIANVFLDPLFMFVLFPKEMAVLGAGLATLCSNVVAVIYFVINIKKIGKDCRLTLRLDKGLPSVDIVRELFSVGIPASVIPLLYDTYNILLNKLTSGYGDYQMAALGIVIKVERLSINTCLGIYLGMVPLIAYNFSARNLKRMHDIAAYTLKVAVTISGVAFVMYEIFAGPIVNFFIDDAQTIAYGINFLRIRTIAPIGMAFGLYFTNIYNGIGDGKSSLKMAIQRFLILNIPILFLLNHCFGLYGTIWSQPISEIINVILSAIIYRKYKREKLAVEANFYLIPGIITLIIDD